MTQYSDSGAPSEERSWPKALLPELRCCCPAIYTITRASCHQRLRTNFMALCFSMVVRRIGTEATPLQAPGQALIPARRPAFSPACADLAGIGGWIDSGGS